jgi:carbamoyl-phosphate synthase small subunit
MIDDREAALVLEDGSVFVGSPFGARTEVTGEIVFNTGMTGYEEVVTDPSYRGQMVVMTHPQIGNYGMSLQRAESARPWIEALVVRELARRPHHWEASAELGDELAAWGVPGIERIDTRALVRRLRGTGTQFAAVRQSGPGGFRPSELIGLATSVRRSPGAVPDRSVADVTGWAPTGGDARLTVIDLGIKWNILRSFEARGIGPRVVPWNTTASAILESRPRAIVISNGPGDPESLPAVVRTVRELSQSDVPVLGICLGHQLLGLAAGGTTSRLRYGHHGGNHPVRDLRTGAVAITTQNHEFQVDRGSVPDASGLEVSHVSLNDHSVEGLRHRGRPVWSIQFHPEGAPGPRDSESVFDELLAVAGISIRSAA